MTQPTWAETHVPPPESTARPKVTRELALPPLDSPGGYAIAATALFALVFALLFVADYSGMTDHIRWISSIALLVGAVGTFALATVLGADIATYQRLDLDLARTVIAHLTTNTAPAPDAPLAGVWRAYVTVADESRRVARVHAYAFGPFLAGTLLSLAAALVTGLAEVWRFADLLGIAVLIEFFGFSLLILGGAALLLTVGYSDEVAGFHRFAAHRWRRNSARLPAVEEALESVPWLPEFHRGIRESRTDPTDSTLGWISP